MTTIGIKGVKKGKKESKNSSDFLISLDLECPKPNSYSLFYDWKHHLKPVGLGGAIKL